MRQNMGAGFGKCLGQGKDKNGEQQQYSRGGVLLSKKIIDMVLLAGSVIIAVAKAMIEQEKSQENREKNS